jgi:hypothetical protein
MKRRMFFTTAAAATAGLVAWRPGWAEKATPATAPATDDVDPYFLDPGIPTEEEAAAMVAFADYEEKKMQGQPALLPRGGKPKRAPNFRFLYWNGALGSPEGRLTGPLTLQPGIDTPPPYQVNAQIMGFNASKSDWSGSSGKGTLTIEFRARSMGEPLTWLFAQQFEVMRGAGTTIGMEYVAQRKGKPDPVVSDDPNVDMRIQLMRYKSSPQLFRKILKIGASLLKLPFGGNPLGSMGSTGSMSSMGGMNSMYAMNQAPAVMRVPRLAEEGVAFAQATVGGTADDTPIWRGGFTSFGIASGGSRIAMRPGYWVAIDDVDGVDYTKLRLDDLGGRVGIVGPSGAIDLNYLVLAVEVSSRGGMNMMRGEIKQKG